MNIMLKRTYIIVALTILITAQSCLTIQDPPIVPDPEFGGQWVGGGAELLIVVQNLTIRAVGFNNSQNATWDSLTFTGDMNAAGAAEGIVQVWGVNFINGRENSILIAEFSLEIRRAENTITLNLSPLQETYVLLRQ